MVLFNHHLSGLPVKFILNLSGNIDDIFHYISLSAAVDVHPTTEGVQGAQICSLTLALGN